jgi:PAS domain S-box-containing protein
MTIRNRPDLVSPERLARLVLDNAQEFAILTATFDGTITSWSPGAERVFRYGASEAIGNNIEMLFTPSDRSTGAPQQELQKMQRDGRAENSRWHLRKDGEWFWGNGVSLRYEDQQSAGMLKILRDETAQKRADEQRILLLNELNHRIKNTLATVQSIAEQTLRTKQVDPATRVDLTRRLVALSEAHNVLVEENWAGADIRTITGKTLQPHVDGHADRITMDGPPVWLSPSQAVAMSLAIHELATNAIKYGALSTPGGSVRATWNIALDDQGARHMSYLWEESGGPAVAQPERSGFGTRLISRSFNQQNGGRARLVFQPEGVCCIIELSLSGPDEAPILDIGRAKGPPRP